MQCWCLYTQQMSGRAKKSLGMYAKLGVATAIAMLRAVCSVRGQRGVGGGGSSLPGTSLFYALARVI